MEWLNNTAVVGSATSTQQLDLVFSLVSKNIHNQIYTCQVTRNNGVHREQNLTVKVDSELSLSSDKTVLTIKSLHTVPSDAIAFSIIRSGIFRAGEVYSLTCSVSKTVESLLSSPSAIWTTDWRAITDTEIFIATDSDDSSTNSTLTFNPLRTSHGGNYYCNSSLTINKTLRVSTHEELIIQSNNSITLTMYGH